MKVHLTPQTPHTLSMFLSSHQSSSCLCQSVRRARWMEPSKPQLSTGIRPLHFVCWVQGEVYSYGIQIVIFILRKQILELYGKKYLKLRKIKCDFVESIPWICSPSPDATSTSVKPSRGKSRIFRLQDLVSNSAGIPTDQQVGAGSGQVESIPADFPGRYWCYERRVIGKMGPCWRLVSEDDWIQVHEWWRHFTMCTMMAKHLHLPPVMLMMKGSDDSLSERGQLTVTSSDRTRSAALKPSKSKAPVNTKPKCGGNFTSVARSVMCKDSFHKRHVLAVDIFDGDQYDYISI